MEKAIKLFYFISEKVAISETDKELIAEKMTFESFKKGDLIIRSNQVCTKLYFVNSGIYRVYKIVDGKEITSYFNYENRNPFVASFVSLLTGTPSAEIVECIEDGELISIQYSDWKAIYSESRNISTFGRIMAEFNYVLAMERIEALQYHSATDRYEAFLKIYPNLMNLIPHHYIASYLGVAPESLSRIRKGISKSKS
jgi:CRP-like cAMP-binding protein